MGRLALSLWRSRVVGGLCLAFSFYALADDQTGSALSITQFNDLRTQCETPPVASRLFPTAAQLVNAYVLEFCSGALRDDMASNALDAILEVTKALQTDAKQLPVDWSSDEGDISLDVFAEEVGNTIQAYIDVIDGGASVTQGLGLPSLAYSPRSIDWPTHLTNGDLRVIPTSQSDCTATVQAVSPDVDCARYLQDFRQLYTNVARFYTSSDAEPTWAALNELDSEWTQFMEETLDQTPLELLVNGYFFRREQGAARSLAAPPKAQHIVLKPYVAGDYLGEAPDGSQLNETVVLDLWGMKRWDAHKVPWYQPLGFSIHTAYSDRPAAKDWGIGLSLHFTEMNTIGITDFGGQLGVFLSFDFWKNATDAFDKAGKRVERFRMHRRDYLQCR